MGEAVSNNLVIVILGILSAIAGILSFITGKNLPEILAKHGRTPALAKVYRRILLIAGSVLLLAALLVGIFIGLLIRKTEAEIPEWERLSSVTKGREYIEYGGYYYYATASSTLMRLRVGDLAKREVRGDVSRLLAVDGGWIYYISEEGYLKRIRIDNTDEEVLHPMAIANPVLESDWIYFLSSNSASSTMNTLYRIKMDGAGCESIGNADIYAFVIGDDRIYYIEDETHHIYKMRLDGTGADMLDGPDPLEKVTAKEIQVEGNWIYYIDNNDHSDLYRMTIHGEENKRLVNGDRHTENIVQYCVYGDDVFLIMKFKGLCRVSTDGDGFEVLSGGMGLVWEIGHIENGWVYYNDNRNYYKIQVNGKNDQLLFSMRSWVMDDEDFVTIS